MPDNAQAKKEIRLIQCVRIVNAVIASFDEETVLNAVAFATSDEGRRIKELTSDRAREILATQPAPEAEDYLSSF